MVQEEMEKEDLSLPSAYRYNALGREEWISLSGFRNQVKDSYEDYRNLVVELNKKCI